MKLPAAIAAIGPERKISLGGGHQRVKLARIARLPDADALPCAHCPRLMGETVGGREQIGTVIAVPVGVGGAGGDQVLRGMDRLVGDAWVTKVTVCHPEFAVSSLNYRIICAGG